MTEGKYLSIGRLACSGCKIKGLKVLISLITILRYDFQNLVLFDSKTFSKQGLDFSNSYLVPESGHPLEQEQVRKRPREEEDEEQRRVMMSPGVRSKVEQVEEEKKVVVVTKKREEEEERRMEKREVVLQPVPSTQGWQIFQINCTRWKHPIKESQQNQLQASLPRSSLCPPAPNRTTSCRSAAWCSRATPPW